MKTAAAIILAVATLAAAEPQHALPSGTKINCAKANASYCMGGDIILRCGPDALGEPARCSPNVSGTPPAGAAAVCWESSRDAGDAVCHKNCVVYAAKEPFTLPADKCTPSATQTGTGSTTATSTSCRTSVTTTTTTRSSSSSGCSTGTGSSSSSWTATIPTQSKTGGNWTATIPTESSTRASTKTLTTTVSPKPTATPPATNNAAANSAVGGVLALGLAVAALF